MLKYAYLNQTTSMVKLSHWPVLAYTYVGMTIICYASHTDIRVGRGELALVHRCPS